MIDIIRHIDCCFSGRFLGCSSYVGTCTCGGGTTLYIRLSYQHKKCMTHRISSPSSIQPASQNAVNELFLHHNDDVS